MQCKTKISALVLSGLVTAMLSVQAFAMNPVNTTIPFTVDEHPAAVSITAEADAPVPDETVYNNATSGEFTMTYTEPGDYRYSVTQSKGSDPDVTYDTSTYHVTVSVYTGTDGVLQEPLVTLSKGDDAHKPESIEFHNAAPNEPAPDNKPDSKTGEDQAKSDNTGSHTRRGTNVRTGDDNSILFYACCLVLAAMCAILILFMGKRRKEEKNV